MSTLVMIASAVVGALVGGQQLWSKVVHPRRRSTKLRRAFTLMEDWFNEIDTRLESGLDLPKLSNMEAKVERYLKDHQLTDYQLKFTPKLRSRFLRMCGIRREFHHDTELFEKYSRMRTDCIDLLGYWMLLVGAFYQFHRKYQNAEPDTNYADVEMRLKLLRLYLNIKEE